MINFTYSDNSSVNAAEAQPVITEKSIAEITEANPVVLDETTDESVQLDATKATPKVADALLYPEERDELLAKIIEGIDSIDFVAKDISIDLRRNTIKLDDPDAVQRELVLIQTECSKLLLSLDVTQKDMNIRDIYVAASKVQALVAHVEKCIKADFKKIPELDLHQPITKSATDSIGMGDVVSALSHTDTALTYISKSVQFLGINWFNKAYRKVEVANKKYHITEGLFVVGAATAFLGYLIYKTGKFLPEGTLLTTTKGGEPSLIQRGGITVYNNTDPKELNKKVCTTITDKTTSKLEKALGSLNPEVSLHIKEAIQSSYEETVDSTSMVLNYGRNCDFTSQGVHISAPLTGWFKKPKEGFNWVKDNIVGSPPQYDVNGELSPYQYLSSLARLDSVFHIWKIGFVDVAVGVGAVAAYKKMRNSFGNQFTEKKRKLHEYFYGGPIKRKSSEMRFVEGGFEQVIGNEQAKDAMEKVIQFMTDPKKFKRKNIIPPKGILLIGPTRSGKTFVAEKTAGEISKRRKAAGLKEIPFIPVDHKLLAEFSLKGIISTFRQWYGPCIIFIDELHNYRLTSDGDVQTLTDFLTTMSGFQEEEESDDPVIIIGATNNPEKMDPALLQNGRFGTQIICEYPSQIERAIAIEKALAKYNISLDDNDFLAFAQELLFSTEGRSHEDITEVFENALQQSIVSGRALTVAHFEQAMNEEIYHIEQSTKVLDQQEKIFLAAQIAGTTMAIHTYQPDKIITRATMRPVKQPIEEKVWYDKNLKKNYTLDGGVFSFNQHDTLSIESHTDLIAECKTLLAPHIAEEIICGERSAFNNDNNQKAVELLEKHILQGVKVESLSRERKDLLLDQVFDLKNQCEDELREILGNRKEQLDKLSEALIKRSILGQGELMLLVLTAEEKEKLLASIREMMSNSQQPITTANLDQQAEAIVG